MDRSHIQQSLSEFSVSICHYAEPGISSLCPRYLWKMRQRLSCLSWSFVTVSICDYPHCCVWSNYLLTLVISAISKPSLTNSFKGAYWEKVKQLKNYPYILVNYLMNCSTKSIKCTDIISNGQVILKRYLPLEYLRSLIFAMNPLE